MYLVGRGGDLETDLPMRLGAAVSVHATDDPSEGWGWVRDSIQRGRPALVWADIAELPYLRVQAPDEQARHRGHRVRRRASDRARRRQRPRGRADGALRSAGQGAVLAGLPRPDASHLLGHRVAPEASLT
ncbi:BtrH N-terminal domain-containing protein [Nocardioides convexus]|uniref:BtrH N-terminal domain-containing protein n=1 Tax=Nocardioides convexus TaxID=2712224 RepID=UPI0024188735|nr:BtrH N-terminal domain-containing protein [Nocardioides convexus]